MLFLSDMKTCAGLRSEDVRLKVRKRKTAKINNTLRERERTGTLIWREREGRESSTWHRERDRVSTSACLETSNLKITIRRERLITASCNIMSCCSLHDTRLFSLNLFIFIKLKVELQQKVHRRKGNQLLFCHFNVKMFVGCSFLNMKITDTVYDIRYMF